MPSLQHFIARFKRDRRGTIALITAIAMFPLIFFAVGTPIDLARQVQLRSALQNIADNAATAGAKVLADGANEYQACTMATNFATTSLTGSIVNASAANVSATESYYQAGSALSTLASCSSVTSSTLRTGVVSTTPNAMTVAITANLPTSFLSVITKFLPVSVTSTAVGPSSFVYACVNSSITDAADYDQVYFYLAYPNNTYHDVTGTAITFNSSIIVNDKLVDNQGGVGASSSVGGIGSNAISETCGPSTAPGTYEVPIQVGLGNRVGFMMSDTTGANTSNGGPAYYAGYNPPTNAYGSAVGVTQYFYSTNYPASLQTTDGSVTLTIGGTQYSNVNGYSAAIQTLLMDTQCTASDGCPRTTSGGSTYSNIVYFDSASLDHSTCTSAGACMDNAYKYNASVTPAADLVCLVQNGVAYVNASQPSRFASGSPFPFTDAGNTAHPVSNVQEENLIIANTKDSPSLAVASAVYQCPNVTVGSDYNVDPTCSELGSNVLSYSWNDMGSADQDNVNYGDLPFTFSCSPSATDTTPVNTTLVQ